MNNTKEQILKDIDIELDKRLVKDYYGNVTVKVNILAGKVRNVTFSNEKSRLYDT